MNEWGPKTAKLFWTGRSPAVRLPRELRFGPHHLLIAGQAPARGLIVETRNIR